jgi:hypothetical protein
MQEPVPVPEVRPLQAQVQLPVELLQVLLPKVRRVQVQPLAELQPEPLQVQVLLLAGLHLEPLQAQALLRALVEQQVLVMLLRLVSAHMHPKFFRRLLLLQVLGRLLVRQEPERKIQSVELLVLEHCCIQEALALQCGICRMI